MTNNHCGIRISRHGIHAAASFAKKLNWTVHKLGTVSSRAVGFWM